MSNIHFTISTRNSKTGPMLVTTSSNDTCSSDCPFNGNGCYAHYGAIRIHWDKVSNGERAKEWSDFIHAVRSQQNGALWRMSQAGDLPGIDNHIDADKLDQVIRANRGRRGFTFTHKALTERNRELIRNANENGFTINLSADNLHDADQKASLNIGPVAMPVAVDKDNWPKTTPQGRSIVICPNVTTGITCVQCGLCQRVNRKSIVGFPAHGVAKKRVENMVTAVDTQD